MREPDVGMADMKMGQEVKLDTNLNDTTLIVRKVYHGWLYTYIRREWLDGQTLHTDMTTTFVPHK